MPGRFRHFAAIDWSGAAGTRHHGIAVAIIHQGEERPTLVRPGHVWSRAEVRDWLLKDLPDGTLLGFDMGISLPHADRGAFFPGWKDSPHGARSLWALIDDLCSGDPDLSASGLFDHPEASRHFRRHGGREGDLFGGGRGRFRVTEQAQELLGCRPYSNFNLVGAAQVGKSSLTGMRLLHQLQGNLPVWPVDPLPPGGSVITEIYTTIASLAAGRRAGRSKIREISELNDALRVLGCAPIPGCGAISDHASDSLITAAWLRQASANPALWFPAGLTPAIAATEGWTFGAP